MTASKIFFWKADNSGCGFYRCTVPAIYLRNNLLMRDAVASTHWFDAYDYHGRGWLKPDVLVGQRVAREGASSNWQKQRKPFRVFEIDDDLFHLHPSNPGYPFWSQREVQQRLVNNIIVADRVTVTTAELADVLSDYHGDVRLVPNTIPDECFYVVADPRPAGRMTFGWMGSATHEMDWKEAGDQIQRYLRRNPDVRFRTLGADYASAWKLPPEQVQHTGWVPSVSAVFKHMEFHVGLAPLAPHRFNRSKSFLKALEYGSQGIPIIASDYGPYADYIEHEVNGFLVKRPHEWAKYMQAIQEPDLYQAMSLAARDYAFGFRTSKWVGEWERALTPG